MDILTQAHFGQALDIGTLIDEIPQDQVMDICLQSMKLKTGTLMALAMRLGGWISGASPQTVETLSEVAMKLGVTLQMFDDAGNFSSESSLHGLNALKRHEDLYLRRPSWVWAYASKHTSARDYRDFIYAISKLPDESFLKFWIELHQFVPAIKENARQHLRVSLESLHSQFNSTHPKTVSILSEIAHQLETSYG